MTPTSSAGPPLHLAHVCLIVRDLDRTIAFYQGALGLPVRCLTRKGDRTVGVHFAVGANGFIEAFQNPRNESVNRGIIHFCFETPDMDASIAHLRRVGHEVTDKQLGHDQTWAAWLRDPDGNQIELHQYTPGSAQRTGVDVAVPD